MNITRQLLLLISLFPLIQPVQAFSYQDAVILAQDEATVEAFNDLASLLSTKASITGNVTSNDQGSTNASLNGSPIGNYGSLSFDSTGNYTYYLNLSSQAVIDLGVGELLTEVYSYTIKTQNHSSSASLTIQILGTENTGNTEFYALDDEISILELSSETLSGNVTSNDLGFKTVLLQSTPSSPYGYLLFKSDGSYSYQLRSDIDINAGITTKDTFTYRIYDEVGKFDEATLTIFIIGQSAPEEAPETFKAENDVNTITKNAANAADGSTTATGNLLSNDTGAVTSFIVSSQTSDIGSLAYDSSSGAYTYTLFNESQKVRELDITDSIKDSFTYQISSAKGSTAQAVLTMTILGTPGEITSLIEIESNNRSTTATPINMTVPARERFSVKGNLLSSEDKDWYSIDSLGNETLSFDLCPVSTSCYGEKAWVLYVFDKKKLDDSGKETATYSLTLKGDTSGLNYSTNANNHMYLNYNAEAFAGSLVGIIDPCFGESTTLDVGIGDELDIDSTSKTYLIAISSPLKRDGTGCADGTVVLKQPGPSASYVDAAGAPQTETTTQEYVAAFPNSDDQYNFSLSRTGANPIISSQAKSASFSGQTGILSIPNVRVGGEFYSADLVQADSTNRSVSSDNPQFLISKLEKLQQQSFDSDFATYNPENRIVIIPKFLDATTNQYKYLILLYHPGNTSTQQWLEFLYAQVIK